MRKIVVGISGNIAKEHDEIVGGYLKSYVWDFYVEACRRHGAVPVILPVVDDIEDIEMMLDRVDMLIMTGGYDVNPLIYGENPSPKLGQIFPRRDSFDLALIDSAVKRNMSILGICRGYQILNVYFGGTLYQDLSQIEGEVFKHNQGNNSEIATMYANIERDSKLFEIFGKEKIGINSFHHQAIKELGKDLKLVAKTDDGVFEAFEHKTINNIIAVQWHPEMMLGTSEDMNKLFKWVFENWRK